ncbi:MAG: alkaline phosphatase family protein [Acidimicrobiia bacterium]|nr:alkaline phosphatase family protein [Acidimicrobiia bacterium]
MGISRRKLLRAGAALGTVAAGAAVFDWSQGPAALGVREVPQPRLIDPADCPIDHIVVLMMENRSYDHVLGRLPGTHGLTRDMSCGDDDGIPIHVHRVKDMTCTVGDLPHGFEDGMLCYNEGRNDGFVRSNGTQSMGYMSPLEVPWMYSLALEYTVFDHWHCSLLAGTWPNRRYLCAGTTGGSRTDDFAPGKFGYWERTVFHQLAAAGISWGVYYTDVPFPALYPDLLLRHARNFKPVRELYRDLAAGRLPQVVMIEPGYLVGTDDHPPRNTQPAQRFMHDVVEAVRLSPLWPRTALVITYDEWGGFFDHVPPPELADDHPDLGRPVGFRVPALMVSPWAHRGAVSHRVKDHTSWLKFVQWRFGLPALTTRNETADNLLEALDFSSPMRTDLAPLPTPRVDKSLSALCELAQYLRPEDDYEFDLPGGEGPESEAAWNLGSVRGEVFEIAHAMGRAPGAPDMAVIEAAARNEQVSGPQFLAKSVSAGVIPAELDLRGAENGATPSPYLAEGDVPASPAWLDA